MMGRSRTIRASGFTLIESAICTLVVAVMLAAALSVVGTAARGTVREQEWRRAHAIARSVMNEALATAFNDPQGGTGFGVDAGESASNRTTFDDIDDFNGYTQYGLTDTSGKALSWGSGWTIRVDVHNVAVSDPTAALATTDDTGLRRVTVNVSAPGGQQYHLIGLKARSGVGDAFKPEVGVSRVTGVRISMRTGSRGPAMTGSAALFNAPPTTLAAAPASAEGEKK